MTSLIISITAGLLLVITSASCISTAVSVMMTLSLSVAVSVSVSPSGWLNKVSLFISTTALLLLLGAGIVILAATTSLIFTMLLLTREDEVEEEEEEERDDEEEEDDEEEVGAIMTSESGIEPLPALTLLLLFLSLSVSFSLSSVFGMTFTPFLECLFIDLFLDSFNGTKALAAMSLPGSSIPIAASTPHTDETSIFRPNINRK